jgi:hypothetical protein
MNKDEKLRREVIENLTNGTWTIHSSYGHGELIDIDIGNDQLLQITKENFEMAAKESGLNADSFLKT